VTGVETARPAERGAGAEWVGGRADMIVLALLVLAVATDRLGIHVGQLTLRIELLIAPLIIAWAVLRSWGETLGGWGLVEAALTGWVLVNAVSSGLFSPDPRESLKNTAVLAGLFMVYLAARMLLRSRRMLVWAAVAWVGAGVSVTLLGVLSAVWYNVAGPNPGVLLERFYRDEVFTVMPKVQSTMWEPNIFGSYSLTVLALAFTLGLAPELRAGVWRGLSIVATALAAAGMMLSMTRTVWIVGPVLVAAAALAAIRLRVGSGRQLMTMLLVPALLGGALGLGLGLSMEAPGWRMGEPWELTEQQVNQMVREYMFGSEQVALATTPAPGGTPGPTAVAATPVPANVGSAVGDRLGEVLNEGQVGSLERRAEIYSRAFDGWLQRPLLGWGAGSYPLVYPPRPGGGYWIANAELHALFDTGIVGLALLVGALGIAAAGAVRALRASASEWRADHCVTFGLLLAGAGLALTYQLTDGTWLGFTWVLVAMMAAAGRYVPGREEA
jgi:hypothetical protein